MSTEELFIDFTKVPNEVPSNKIQSNTLSSEKPKKQFLKQQDEGAQKARNRFASVAPQDLVHMNTISEVIKVTLSEEAATNPSTLIKFAEIDLSRVINKVISKLHLSPNEESTDKNLWKVDNLENASVTDLKKMIKMQNLLLDEIGKSMQTISRQNADLIASNKKLLQDRVIANQARDDLHKLLLEKEKQLQSKVTNEIKEEKRAITKRLFLDETAILDAALEEFRSKVSRMDRLRDGVLDDGKRKSDILPNDSDHNPDNSHNCTEKKSVTFIQPKEAFAEGFQPENVEITHDSIVETADMIGARKLFEPASTVGVELKCAFKNLVKNMNNPYRNVRIGTPKRYPETNFNCGHIETLRKYLSHYVLSSSSAHVHKELMESISVETYISKILHHLQQLSTSFQECLDVLAEEKRLSRQLRLKLEKYERKAKYRKSENERHTYLNRKKDLANILEPISRPSTAFELEKFQCDNLDGKDTMAPSIVVAEEKQKTRATTASPGFPRLAGRKCQSSKKRPSTTPMQTTSIYIPSIKVGIPFGSIPELPIPKSYAEDKNNDIPDCARDDTHIFATKKPVPTKHVKVYLETILS
ncbi:hypothetical protein HK103_006342 [Boothiomyces macroporosus]|uniref:Uncharacterized protein n=1 Tax=Boothiomyces macroporosus TaxID=261099 RepID=A0AAD5UDV1_9FUNG|nr:hypothetical protein HK103_006342 [Boothiomyces macroporosus]